MNSASVLPADQATVERQSELRSIGYLSGYTKPTDSSGVVVSNKEMICPGLTLFCSGHATVALLMDLEGNTVHEWEITFDEVWPESLDFEVNKEHKEFFRRTHVYANGDLLVLFEYIGIVKLDRHSNVLWSVAGEHHHDIKVLDDGTIVTLRKLKKSSEEIKAVMGENAIYESATYDVVAFISPEGSEIDRIDLLEALCFSEYAPILNQAQDTWDLFHANSVSIIKRPIVAQKTLFREGDIIVSMRKISTIVVVDLASKTVKWALSGKWLGQHQAEYLANGNFLVLDNMGGSAEYCDFDRSQVIEIDPMTQEIVWRFNGTPDKPIFTHWLGYNQRLPNGNTLISESTNGRLQEVTSDGEIIWEYVSPYRAGENGELIATLMGAQRISLGALPFLTELPD